MNIRIVSFEQVDELYKKGINLCVGCKYEHYASCTEYRLSECNNQYLKIKGGNEDESLRTISDGCLEDKIK